MAAVEKATGAKYVKHPKVRISTPQDLLPILHHELDEVLSAQADAATIDAQLSLMTHMLLAKYEPGADVVHVVPGNAALVAKLLNRPAIESEPVLRVILAHEATHALDFQRFGLEAERQKRKTTDGQQAFGATIEGHAQIVARAISDAWGIRDAFDLYVDCISEVPPGTEGAAKLVAQTMATQVGFAYHQGLAFFDAVKESRGVEGMEAALRTPPVSPREIEHPELWLHPESAPKEPSLDDLLLPLKALVEKTGLPARELSLLEASLAPQFAMLPPEQREHAFDGYEESRLVTASSADQNHMLTACLMRFATADAAAHFEGIEWSMQKIKDDHMSTGSIRITRSSYEKGVGKDRARQGFEATKTVAVGSQSVTVTTAIAREGRYVLELTNVAAPNVDEEASAAAIDETLDGLAQADTGTEAAGTPR